MHIQNAFASPLGAESFQPLVVLRVGAKIVPPGSSEQHRLVISSNPQFLTLTVK